jgi:hypothetical protein
MSKTVPVLVLSDFEDATWADRYAKGETYAVEEGRVANFEAAGLVRKLTADEVLKLPGNGEVKTIAKPSHTRKRPRAAK